MAIGSGRMAILITSAPEQPALFVTLIIYVPAVVTVIADVVAPVLQE